MENHFFLSKSPTQEGASELDFFLGRQDPSYVGLLNPMGLPPHLLP